MKIRIAVFAVALIGHFVLAQSPDTSVDLNLQQSRFLGAVENSGQVSDYSFLSTDVDVEHTRGPFRYRLNPVGQDAFNVKNEFYFGAPEAFVQYQQSDYGVTVGRQKRHWSFLDEDFNIGVWQPQLRWDYLAPKQEGLIGVFFDFNLTSEWVLTLMGSPLFLPDQGPNYQLTNGEFTSDNRWFRAPQSRLIVFGDQAGAPLYYQIDRPSNESIIMNSGAALALSYSSAPVWAHFSYAYLPQNQIHLGVEGVGSIKGETLEGVVTVHPAMVKHQVATVETGFDRVDDSGYLSLTADLPDSSKFPSNYYESPLDSMLIAGGAYQHYLFSVAGAPMWGKVLYMRAFDVHTVDKQGLVDSDQVQSSLDRYPYREVAAVEFKSIVRKRGATHIDARMRYNYSVPERGGWLSAALDWNEMPVTWSLGLDFLGSDVDDNSPNAGLYTRYKSNSRVFAGVGYVF